MALLPQTSLNGANAATPVPQSTGAPTTPPPAVNPAKVGSQAMALRSAGMGTAQAMNKAAINPVNKMAKGGMSDLAKSSPDAIKASAESNPPPKDAVDWATKAIEGTPAAKSYTPPTDNMEKMFQDYTPSPKLPQPQTSGIKAKGQDATKAGVGNDYKKGGQVQQVSKPVAEANNTTSIKDMSLGDVIKLIGTHPDVSKNMNAQNMGNSNVQVPTKPAPVKANVGGGLASSDSEIQNNESGEGAAKMAIGGGLEGDTEADNITSYAPDGTPIIENADGTQQYGDVNQLLGRPDSAPTAGTGELSTDNTGAANAIGSGNPTGPAQNVSGNAMAKGGEEQGSPPGSLQSEVADNIDAKLSPGEWVASADTVRYFGLKFLTEMQDHARQQLEQMQNTGGIRTPGDGKNPDQQQGQFVQDQQPNTSFYTPQDKGQPQPQPAPSQAPQTPMKTGGGILRRATGGGVFEEDQYKKGGPIRQENTQYGQDNLVSSPTNTFDRGGIVTSTSSSLTPKKMESAIPTGVAKQPRLGGPKTIEAPKLSTKMKTGGLLKKAAPMRDVNAVQPFVGS